MVSEARPKTKRKTTGPLGWLFRVAATIGILLWVRAFVASVLEGKPVTVCGADGRAPVVMALAARKSYDEGRPVKLEEIATLATV